MSDPDNPRRRPSGLARAISRRRRAGSGPEALALDRLPDRDIVAALRDLPVELRVAVYLADVEGCCYQEIADIMGTPVTTVAARLHYGRGRLRDRLAMSAARRGLAAAPG